MHMLHMKKIIVSLFITTLIFGLVNSAFSVSYGSNAFAAEYKPIHGGYPNTPIFQELRLEDLNPQDQQSIIVLATNLRTDPSDLFSMLYHRPEREIVRGFLLKPLELEDLRAYELMFSYPEDGQVYMRYYTNGRPKAKEDTAKLLKTRVEKMKAEGRPKGLYFTIYRPTDGKIAGQIAIGALLDDPLSPPEVAYIVLKDYSRHLYATNALMMTAKIVAKYYPEVQTIIATVHPENIPSIRVLEHAEFVTDGTVQSTSNGPRLNYKLNLFHQ